MAEEVREYAVTLTDQQARNLPHMPGYANVEVREIRDDHVLEVSEDGKSWSIEHPLRCRQGSLHDCPVHKAATHSLITPGVPGRYLVRVADDQATKLAFVGVPHA